MTWRFYIWIVQEVAAYHHGPFVMQIANIATELQSNITWKTIICIEIFWNILQAIPISYFMLM